MLLAVTLLVVSTGFVKNTVYIETHTQYPLLRWKMPLRDVTNLNMTKRAIDKEQHASSNATSDVRMHRRSSSLRSLRNLFFKKRTKANTSAQNARKDPAGVLSDVAQRLEWERAMMLSSSFTTCSTSDDDYVIEQRRISDTNQR